MTSLQTHSIQSFHVFFCVTYFAESVRLAFHDLLYAKKYCLEKSFVESERLVKLAHNPFQMASLHSFV